MLDRTERRRTAEAIARIQSPAGWIPWEPGRHADPWNMIEAAIGLDVGGLGDAAERTYAWLAQVQESDGSWPACFLNGVPVDRSMDSNFSAYIATGTWLHFMVSGDDAWLRGMWPCVERALDAVLDMQLPTGAIGWARDPQGRKWDEALITSSSSIFHSLWCGITMAEVLGNERPDWELSLAALGASLREGRGPFLDKSRFAMDHYYPALTGVLEEAAASEALDRCVERFVIPGSGCLCTDDRPWVTTGESCELAIALAVHGRPSAATELVGWVQQLRAADGLYWTGANQPGTDIWPDERTTWSAASVLMAIDAVEGGPVADLFSGAALAPQVEFDLSDAGERA